MSDQPAAVYRDQFLWNGEPMSGLCGHCQVQVDSSDPNHRVTSVVRGGRGVECVLRGDIEPRDGGPLLVLTPRELWGTCCPNDPACEHSQLNDEELTRYLDTPLARDARSAIVTADLVVPDDPRETLEILADHAIIAAHYLLQLAREDSMAQQVARALISIIQVEVRAVLGEDAFVRLCSECGTTDPMTSPVHAGHLQRSALRDDEEIRR